MEQLDVIDLKILQALVRNGRMGWQELADTIGLSLTPTLRRVRRLESENYILGYAATVSEEALGRPLNVLLFIELERQTKEACALFEAAILDIPALRFCGRVTGKPDYLANAMVRDMAEYQQMLAEVGMIAGVAKLRSNLMLKLVRPYGPPRPFGDLEDGLAT